MINDQSIIGSINFLRSRIPEPCSKSEVCSSTKPVMHYAFNLYISYSVSVSTHTHTVHSLSVCLSAPLTLSGLQRDSFHWLPSRSFLFHSAPHLSSHQCSFAQLSFYFTNMRQSTNGLKSSISTHCHTTIIYNRDQILFLSDYSRLCSCAASETRAWIKIGMSGCGCLC